MYELLEKLYCYLSCLDNAEWVDKYVKWNFTGSSPNAHIFQMYIHLPEQLNIIWILLRNKHKYFLFTTTEQHYKTQTHKAQALRDSATSYRSHRAPLYSRQFPSSRNIWSPPSGLCSMGQTCFIFRLQRGSELWYCFHLALQLIFFPKSNLLFSLDARIT